MRRALAGWLHPHSRAALPLMMEVGGIPCRLQELAGADPERIRAAYGELSEQSVYLRFMRAKQIPSDEQLAFFLDYPKEQQIGLLLTDGQGRPLAQAQSIRRRLHPDRAEFSCIVADHFQHRGRGGASCWRWPCWRAPKAFASGRRRCYPRIAPCWRCCAGWACRSPW